MKKGVLIAALVLCAIPLANWLRNHQPPAPGEPTDTIDAVTLADRASPFLIAPKIGSLVCSDKGYQHRLQEDCATLLARLMDSVEPGGPEGKVQFGYTLSIPIFEMFRQVDDQWQFNQTRLAMYLDLIKTVNRPVVVHIGANHFSPTEPIVEYLSQDPQNLMAYADGKNPASLYFKFPVHMFTLSTRPDLPINRYRSTALEALSRGLLQLQRERPDLLHAVTLVGETYHLSRDIKNKMGNHFEVEFTDYSDVSKGDFRRWLQDKFHSLAAFNRAAVTNFPSWQAVEPPYEDFRDTPLRAPWRHFDSFAAGQLPVFGWAVCEDQRDPVLAVYLNGEHLGDAWYGLNRLDVYRNAKKVDNPNVGFRYQLDYRDLPPGDYELDITVTCPGQPSTAMGRLQLTVLDRQQVTAQDLQQSLDAKKKTLKAKTNGATAYVGFPRHREALFYNPFAALWQEFRAFQVENYLRSSWQTFTAAGFPRDKVFVAQMVPDLHGTWNQAQLGTSSSLSPDSPYQPALMLYGGLAVNEHIERYTRGGPYGVAQLNPMMHKHPAGTRAITFHGHRGAAFIAPYYMSVEEDETYSGKGSHSRMLIYPDSPMADARDLYHAIRAAVKQ